MQASEPISSASFRYISGNIQFSRMKNVILPQVSSQLYSYGYNDFISDVPMQIEDNLNPYESSFYDSSLYSQQDQLDGALTFCSQFSIDNFQSGPSSLMTIKNLDCPSFGASHTTTKSPTMPNNYNNTIKQQQLSHQQRLLPKQLQENAICSTMKRPMENYDVIQRTSPEFVVANKQSDSEWTSNKMRAVCCQDQLQDFQIHKEIKELQREKAPVRRSQKLADRVTALQKLVSPYGKTDTASVLHEASIFIKVLQDQIENMLHILSSSSEKESPQCKVAGEKEFDLRNKGLCLVPISITKNLIEDVFNQYYC